MTARELTELNMTELDRRYWHGLMDYAPVKAGQTAEERLVSIAFGYRPSKAERRRFSGAISR